MYFKSCVFASVDYIPLCYKDCVSLLVSQSVSFRILLMVLTVIVLISKSWLLTVARFPSFHNHYVDFFLICSITFLCRVRLYLFRCFFLRHNHEHRRHYHEYNIQYHHFPQVNLAMKSHNRGISRTENTIFAYLFNHLSANRRV